MASLVEMQAVMHDEISKFSFQPVRNAFTGLSHGFKGAQTSQLSDTGKFAQRVGSYGRNFKGGLKAGLGGASASALSPAASDGMKVGSFVRRHPVGVASAGAGGAFVAGNLSAR